MYHRYANYFKQPSLYQQIYGEATLITKPTLVEYQHDGIIHL